MKPLSRTEKISKLAKRELISEDRAFMLYKRAPQNEKEDILQNKLTRAKQFDDSQR